MATKDETNTAKAPGFSALKGYQRRAVILRYEGKTYAQITANINDEFATTYAERSVADWFVAGGQLEVAYHEFMDAMAAQSLKEARQNIKLGSRAAATTLIAKLKSGDEAIQVRAALGLLNKFIPDKQVVLDGPGLEEDLPAELADLGDVIAAGGTDGPVQPNDTQQGESDNSQAGPAGGEAVS